jgi:hypothetical protein
MSAQSTAKKPTKQDVEKVADDVDAQVQTSPVILQSN